MIPVGPLRRAHVLRRVLSDLERDWPEGKPFSDARLIRAKPAKTVISLESARGPVVASYFGSDSDSDQRPEGVAAAHSLLAEKLGAGAVPRLIALVQGANLVVTEQVPGHTAADLIRKRPDSARYAITSSARWLAALHGLIERPDAAHDFSGRVEVATPAAPPPLAAEIIRLSDALTGVQHRQVKFHNDFKPDNVVIDGARICAIDFRNTRWRPPHVDAAQFLTRAAIAWLSVRDAEDVNRIGLPRAVTQPFDAAYGEQISTAPLTELFILTNLVLAEVKRADRPVTRRAIQSRAGANGRGITRLLASAQAALTPPAG